MDDFDVGTYSEHNCEIMPRCYFFISVFIPLELIIFPDFPVIPLNSSSTLVVQHQHHPLEWNALSYSIHILPWIALYYGPFLSNLWFLHLQPSLDTLVLDIGSNSIRWTYNE